MSRFITRPVFASCWGAPVAAIFIHRCRINDCPPLQNCCSRANRYVTRSTAPNPSVVAFSYTNTVCFGARDTKGLVGTKDVPSLAGMAPHA